MDEAVFQAYKSKSFCSILRRIYAKEKAKTKRRRTKNALRKGAEKSCREMSAASLVASESLFSEAQLLDQKRNESQRNNASDPAMIRALVKIRLHGPWKAELPGQTKTTRQ